MEIIVRPEEEGLPLLEVLQLRLPAAPSAYLRQLLRGGKVRREKPLEDLVAPGEHLYLPESARLRQLREGEGDVAILHESREILAVYKPSGVAVHRGVGHEEDNLARRVERLVQKRGAPFRTAPVHRLDAETSGPVLFAKGKKAAAVLGGLFMAGSVEKRYLALAQGRLAAEGSLNSPVPAKGSVKEALTLYTALAATGDFTYLDLRLISGRTHQIRRHLSEAGHPLAGDRRYGGKPVPGLNRLFLHCRRLRFIDPFCGTEIVIDSPLPPELNEILGALGLFGSGEVPP